MNAKLLLIEDEEDFASLFLECAKHLTWTCWHDATGANALDLARKQLPNLIVLDLNLPHKSGLGLLSDLKNDATLANIPVVVFSGNSETATIKEALKLGAACYYSKGGEWEDLFTILSQYLPSAFNRGKDLKPQTH